MRAKRSMTQVYLVSMLLLATLPVISIGYLSLSQRYESFELQVAETRQTYIDTRKHLLKNEVARILDYINYEKSRVEQRLHQSVQASTVETYKIITALDTSRSSNTPAAKQQSRQKIAQTLKASSLDDEFVLLSGEGEVILTPFDRSSDIAQRDQYAANGRNLVQEMVLLAKKQGEGFLRFNYSKGTSVTEQSERLVFLKYYAPLDLLVLSGAFVEDVERQVKQEVIERLASQTFDNENAIPFVSDADGVRLVYPVNPDWVGTAHVDKTDAKTGELLFETHQQAALKPGGDFVKYNWYGSGVNDSSAAINFVRMDESWGWLVGAGFFLDKLEQAISIRREELREKLISDAVNMAVFVVLLIIVLLLISNWFARKSRYGFSLFTQFFIAANKDSTYIDKNKVPYSEFAELAESVNNMIDERRNYEQALEFGERRFELALGHSRQFVWDLQVATGELKTTGNAFKALGYSEEELDFNSIDSVYAIAHSDDRKVITAGIAAAGEAGDVEFRLRDSRGNYCWFFSRSGPVDFDNNGQATRLLGVLTDISERKALEEELISARISAEDANHAKNQFLASMSHELRTPLNGVLGYAQLMLRDQSLTAEQRQYLAEIIESGDNLLVLISNILDLSMIESDVIDVVERPCDLRILSQSIKDIIAKKAKAKSLQFEVVIDDNVPVIFSDETKLKQILLNLLSNAIKYTRHGVTRLRIVASNDKEKILFHVDDSGVGISAEKVNKLFQPFQPSLSRAGDGAGLGLAICNRLAESLGGSISVESTVDKGSCFTLTLPLKLADDACFKFPDTAVEETVKEVGELLVLVADDNDINRKVLVAMLDSVGVATVEAENGEQVLARLKSEKISAVLMDIQMPGLDGVAATAAIRQDPDWEDTVVIAVSASVYDSDIEEMKLAGCDDFVSKPINAKELIEKLSKYLGVVLQHSFGVRNEAAPTAAVLTPPAPTDFNAAFYKQLDRAIELGDVEAVRKILVTEQNNNLRIACQQWLRSALERIDQLDLDAVANLLKQLRDSEKAAL